MATNLETIDAAIQTLASEGIVSVTIGGETVQTRSLKELLEWRDRLAGQQATSANRAGLGIRNQTWVPYYP
jgi:hypothetical protein